MSESQDVNLEPAIEGRAGNATPAERLARLVTAGLSMRGQPAAWVLPVQGVVALFPEKPKVGGSTTTL